MARSITNKIRQSSSCFMRVLTNLVLNARDATRSGGTLTLRVRAPGPDEAPAIRGETFVVVEVEDTGVGMTDEIRERVFEPFLSTKEVVGRGLGLASVRDILERRGGRTTVTSSPGAGTRMTLLMRAGATLQRPGR